MLAFRQNNPVEPCPNPLNLWGRLPWPESANFSERSFCEGDDAPFAALDAEILNGRFRAWAGASGRRYIFSVYDPEQCPAYCYGILIGTATTFDGHCRVFYFADTGALPEQTMRRAREAADAMAGKVEFHVHLLTQTDQERAGVAADIWSEIR